MNMTWMDENGRQALEFINAGSRYGRIGGEKGRRKWGAAVLTDSLFW
jgi:hypothetical protein